MNRDQRQAVEGLFAEAVERADQDAASRRARDERLAELARSRSGESGEAAEAPAEVAQEDAPLGRGIEYQLPPPADSAWVAGQYIEYSQEGVNSSAADLASRIPRGRR